jgi:hypothetical protein
MFYNGFNLLLDIAIAAAAYWAGHAAGHYDGYEDGIKAEAELRDAFEFHYLKTTKENDNA